MAGERPRVVIIGAGFAGLRVARELAEAPVDVLLLERNNYHLFQPLLYQVATAGLGPDEIAHPVRAILRGQSNLEVRMLEVEQIDLEARRVRTGGETIVYDQLVYAAGARSNFFGNHELERHAFGLKQLSDATAIRNHVLACVEQAEHTADPERRRALLSFVVVGGGPTGVEMAGALSELLRLGLSRDHPTLDLSQARIVLLEARERLLEGMPEELACEAVRQLERRQVSVRFGSLVEGYDGRVVRLKGDRPIEAETLIWAAGVQGVELAERLGVELERQRRIPVLPTLQLPGRPEVHVIGDAAWLEHEGAPLPMMAPVAIQMGETAADNIRRGLRGEPAREFRYRNPGSLATIGRKAAVAHVMGRSFKGPLAWLVWLLVHLVQLIGFRNRLVVLINWAWEYVLYERSSRLITPD